MTDPTYVRRTWRDVLGIALIYVVSAAAVGLGIWQGVKAIRADAVADERAKVQQFTRSIDAITQASWQHERDSLRAETGKRDTIWRRVAVKAQAEAATPVPPTRDSVPAVELRACRATLDTTVTACEAFREAATHALAQADTQHTRDSTRLVGAFSMLVAKDDTIDVGRKALARAVKRPGYKAVATGTAIGAAFGVILCAVVCK